MLGTKAWCAWRTRIRVLFGNNRIIKRHLHADRLGLQSSQNIYFLCGSVAFVSPGVGIPTRKSVCAIVLCDLKIVLREGVHNNSIRLSLNCDACRGHIVIVKKNKTTVLQNSVPQPLPQHHYAHKERSWFSLVGMSNFCHDEYDHPLLWCDGKRRLVERQEAAQSQALVRQQKEDERRQRIVEQREVTVMTC